MPRLREQLAGHREQPRGVAGVRLRRRVVARLQRAAVGQAQPDGGRLRGRVEAEHDHRSRDLDPPAILAAMGERDAQARARELALGVRRPLDEGDPPRAEVVGEQVRVLLLEARQAVEVEVRDGQRVAARGSGGRC